MIGAEFSCDQPMIETNAAYGAARPNNHMHRSRRSAVLMVSRCAVRRLGDVER
jgi:hypothetical protein